MAAAKSPLWAELLKAAARGYINAKQKQIEEERAAAQSKQEPAPRQSAVPRNPIDDMERIPGESKVDFVLRKNKVLSHHLEGQRRIREEEQAWKTKLAKMRMGYFDDGPSGKSDERTRECGACNGRGRYMGVHGDTYCDNCFGTGRVRRHVIK
ncbi:DnaJ-like cysteine-rich domain-containing protein [Litoreibacter arenae]|uniref:Uncharacterized protein n=1 Tax=Litoreibacter arenae DSM 19593 TaxID=1123360 RepID=S9QHV7_9RHOB|nr:hypothetical protein [Litoreibacter arenae]EPX79123.1 hypothetical protein thalar_01942 [Litoreibacter arenae DSM 19593]